MIINYKSSSSFAPHLLKVRFETFLHIKRPGSFQSQNIITCGKAVADEKVTLRNNIRMQTCRSLGCQNQRETRLPSLPETAVNKYSRCKAFSLCGYENMSSVYNDIT